MQKTKQLVSISIFFISCSIFLSGFIKANDSFSELSNQHKRSKVKSGLKVIGGISCLGVSVLSGFIALIVSEELRSSGGDYNMDLNPLICVLSCSLSLLSGVAGSWLTKQGIIELIDSYKYAKKTNSSQEATEQREKLQEIA